MSEPHGAPAADDRPDADLSSDSALPRISTGNGSSTGDGRSTDAVNLREDVRQKMLEGFGGWTGMVIAALPTLVFVIVNAATSLRIAVAAAVTTALVLTVYRLIRRQSIQQALSGLFGVVLAALIAQRTGQARGFFLVGIWSSFAYGAAFLLSIVLRRPLIGVVWEFLDPTPTPTPTPTPAPAQDVAFADLADEVSWRHRPALFRAYLWATVAATLVFAARAAVQLSLFQKNATDWLAVARIAMGYPLTIAAAALAWWLVRRARQSLVDSAGTGV